MPTRLLLVLAGLTTLTGATLAAIPAPPPPEVYDVRVRYRIDAFRRERVAQYFEMMRYLQAQGFRRDPDEDVSETEPEDVAHVVLRGTVPAKKARLLLGERHVKSLVLTPQGAMLPAMNELVRVDLQLATGLPPDRQRLLHEQTAEVLASINFRGGISYDHRAYTRLLGSIPAGQLDALSSDLRKLPAGARQPAPFASTWPVHIAEVLPGMALPGPRLRPAPVPPAHAKLSPDLREVLADAARAGAPQRLEAVLAQAPPEDDRTWVTRIAGGLPGVTIEGAIGPVVTVLAPPAAAPSLAAREGVLGMRLPRVARPGSQAPGGPDEAWKPLLDRSGLARLHDLKHRGKGQRVAIVDTDFAGWQALVGKQLPAVTRLIDLTTERNRDLLPDPTPGPGPGPGTRRAVTLMRAAPEAELTLVRVDPAAPYLVYQAARAINGEDYSSINLNNRLRDLEDQRRALDLRREALLEGRRLALESFELEGEGAKRRQDYQKKQAEFDRDFKAYSERLNRYFEYRTAVRALKGIRLVASGLVWDEGFAADGTSTLTRYFDDRPFRGALWFQAAGDARGQSWTGPFRDADDNGVIDFAPADAPLPPGLWTQELNLLGWRTPRGVAGPNLPDGARLRIALQWREVHEPLYQRIGEDPYREPLFRPRLIVLYQPDPEGKARPADDLEVIPQAAGPPVRLAQTPTGATYEIVVEMIAFKAGRYAVRLEGRAPTSTLPRGEATLPAAARRGEVQLRLFLTTLQGPGRAVWQSHVTDGGSVGMPADARSAVTVGAADNGGNRQIYSAGGAPLGMDLLEKPDLLTFDGGAGTADAAAFAAGLAAAARSAAGSLAGGLPLLPPKPGGLLRVPDDWPRTADRPP